MSDVLDRFGAFLVSRLRDVAIDRADGLMSARWKSPGLQALQADLGRLTPEQRAIVRRCVIEAIDCGLHDFLFALQEEHDRDGLVSILVDGQSIAANSDGLHGELYSESGWLARFSQYGAHPDPA